MRIVFLGTPDFGVPSLQALADAGYEVVGVFTQPDKPKGRGNKMLPSPVKERAMQLGIPVYQPVKIRADGVDDLRALRPDLPPLANHFLERDALHVFHHEIARVAVLSHVVHADDVWVGHLRGGLRFPVELAHEIGVRQVFQTQHLHSDLAVALEIPRPVYHRHAARSDDFLQLISS